MIRWLFSWLLRIFLFFSVIGIIAFVVLLWWGSTDFQRGMDFSPKNLPYSVIITDRNGTEIHRSFDQENREWTKIEATPDFLGELTLLAEDKRFHEHIGIDFYGIARAMVRNVEAGRVVQGASTLTQQIARKVFLTDDRTFERKLREAFIALGIENQLSKEEILELYINTAPYGPTASGIRSATRQFFGKRPLDLTVAEAMVMVALPQNPVRLAAKPKVRTWLGDCPEGIPEKECTPFHGDSGYEKERLDILLDNYAEQNGLDARTKRIIWQEIASIELKPRPRYAKTEFQHFQFYVRDFLNEKGFDLTAHPGGLKITTTLDGPLHKKVMQTLQEEEGARLLLEHNAENFSAIVLDHDSRGPLVWVGSKAFWNTQISGQVDMLRSKRQPGSSMKPFIYAGMMAQGYEPNTILNDVPVRFGRERHVLQNADGIFMGWMGLPKALAQSRNVPAAQALFLAGGETKTKQFLDEVFGFTIRKDYPNHPFGWTLALGTSPVKMYQLANAYATLGTAENKEFCPILKIETLLGEEVPNPCDQKPKREITKEIRFFIADALSDMRYKPQGYWRENLPVPQNPGLAIKTGTSNKREAGRLLPADNVVASYSPSATMVLWAGNTDGRALNSGSFSVQSLGPVHQKLWPIVLQRFPELGGSFQKPETVQKVGQYYVHKQFEKQIPQIKTMTVLGQSTYNNNKAKTAPKTQSNTVSTPKTVQPAEISAPPTQELQFQAPKTPRAAPSRDSLRQNIKNRYIEQ